MQDIPEIGDLLREVREALGVSQADLGASLGVDQTAISQYERNRALPSFEVLLKLYGSVQGHDVRAKVRTALLQRMGTSSVEDFQDLLDHLDQSPDVWDWAVVVKLMSRLVALRTRHWRLLKEITELLKSGILIDPAVCRLLALYREHGGSSAVRTSFRKALIFLEVELARPEKGHAQILRRSKLHRPESPRLGGGRKRSGQ